MTAGTYRKITDLPDSLAVFPLPGALLFPRWQLPLNIFEPRYLNMIDDAMSGSRMIGMVQSLGGDKSQPDLAHVGCAGRLTSYSETDDGRYMITLTGVCRFEMGEELQATTPYRQVSAQWGAFAGDLQAPILQPMPSRDVLTTALKDYVSRNEMKADWSAVEDAPIETLVNALCSGCPFSTMEKQALLEAPTLRDRTDTLITLLQMDMPSEGGGRLQ